MKWTVISFLILMSSGLLFAMEKESGRPSRVQRPAEVERAINAEDLNAFIIDLNAIRTPGNNSELLDQLIKLYYLPGANRGLLEIKVDWLLTAVDAATFPNELKKRVKRLGDVCESEDLKRTLEGLDMTVEVPVQEEPPIPNMPLAGPYVPPQPIQVQPIRPAQPVLPRARQKEGPSLMNLALPCIAGGFVIGVLKWYFQPSAEKAGPGEPRVDQQMPRQAG